jgi:hypothetical protein
MRKAVMALVAAATLAIAAVGPTAPAEARGGYGVGIAAGLLGGAIIAGALAAPPYYSWPGYYGPAYYPGYYYGAGYYYGPRYYYGPGPSYVVSPG